LKLGSGQAGIAELEASLDVRERIVEAWASDTISRHALMLSYMHVATAQRDGGHQERAKELLQKAVSLGELLRAMDPTVLAWGHDLHAAYSRLARLDLASGNLPEARRLSDLAVSLAAELASASDQSPKEMSTLAFAGILRGRVLLAYDLPEQAYEVFADAAAIRASLTASDPESPALRDDLAVAEAWLGRSSRQMRRLQQAARHYQLAYDIRKSLYEKQPHVVERALDLIRSQINVAVTHLDCNTQADDTIADSFLTEGERLLRTLHVSRKLVGLEGEYQTLISAIGANQAIIRDRAGHHSDVTSSDSERDTPN